MTAGLEQVQQAAAERVDVGDLAATRDPAAQRWPAGQRWSVFRAGARVGVLEQHCAGGQVWLVGRIHDDVAGDLVTCGPTALCVLRRLVTRRELAAAASPVRR